MILEIDFHSEEALYMQLRNQIVIGIPRADLHRAKSCRRSGLLRKRAASI